jgi:hypothetical protein
MQYQPQPLVGRDQALYSPALNASLNFGLPPHHEVQDVEQIPGDIKITFVAGVMEGDEYFVGQAPGVARLWGWEHAVCGDVIHGFRNLTPARRRGFRGSDESETGASSRSEATRSCPSRTLLIW